MVNPTNRLGRKEPNNDHYRVDFHPEFQQIALIDTETGEFQEKRLGHSDEAEMFLRPMITASWLRLRTTSYSCFKVRLVTTRRQTGQMGIQWVPFFKKEVRWVPADAPRPISRFHKEICL